MTNRISETSPLIYARVAGFGLLLMFILAAFVIFFVLEGLIVPGDAVTTANNIIAHEMLFRCGIISFIIVLILDLLVAWALYIVLQPVNKNLALLAAWLRLVYTIIFGYLIDSFAHFLLSDYADYKAIFLPIVAVPGVIAELSLTLWLVFKGIKVQQTR
jgi:hypothetical protein